MFKVGEWCIIDSETIWGWANGKHVQYMGKIDEDKSRIKFPEDEERYTYPIHTRELRKLTKLEKALK